MRVKRGGNLRIVVMVLAVFGLVPVDQLWAQESEGGRIGPEPKTGAPKGTPKRTPAPQAPRAPDIEMVLIKAGTFTMGSNNGDSDEKPVHRVTISRPFYLGKYEVTQGQWKAVMGTNPSKYTGNDELPVEPVSWDDCQEFIRRFNAKTGMEFRLPTEAEWEYACRAGTTGDYAGNLGDMAWYDKNSGGTPHPVGQKRPNAWGLYDMHGNVREWCQDWYDESYYARSPGTNPTGATGGSYRVIRGGGSIYFATGCRSADRGMDVPGYRLSYLGFRLARSS